MQLYPVLCVMPWSHVVHPEAAATSCDHACAIRGDCMQLWHNHLHDADDKVACFKPSIGRLVECAAHTCKQSSEHAQQPVSPVPACQPHCCSDHRDIQVDVCLSA